MLRSRRLAFWTVHVAVLLLLLKAAVPLLASAAADLQGKGVGEICQIYGVVLAKADPHAEHGSHAHHVHHAHHEASQAPAGESPSEHPPGGHAGGDHCTLTALGIFTVP